MFVGLLIIIFLLFLLSGTTKNRSKRNLCFSLTLILLILFNALKKYSLFPDQEIYEYMLNTLDFEWGRVNVGYVVINKLIHSIWNNYSFLTFICATWVISSYATIIRKYSPYPWLSLFIFIIINFPINIIHI